MLAAQRQSLILDEVNRLGAVRIADLAVALRVSDMTVRRDLAVLAEAGLVVKVHGGVTAVEPASAAGGAESRPSGQVTSERAAKEAIAAEAIRLVEPGAAIGVSGGSTTLAFARLLVDVPGIMVVTNSLPLADVLYAEGRDDQTVILTGGVRTPSGVLVGPVAVETARHLHVDLTFIGTAGMDEKVGFTSSDLLESELAAGDARRRRSPGGAGRPHQVGSGRSDLGRAARRRRRAHHRPAAARQRARGPA